MAKTGAKARNLPLVELHGRTRGTYGHLATARMDRQAFKTQKYLDVVLGDLDAQLLVPMDVWRAVIVALDIYVAIGVQRGVLPVLRRSLYLSDVRGAPGPRLLRTGWPTARSRHQSPRHGLRIIREPGSRPVLRVVRRRERHCPRLRRAFPGRAWPPHFYLLRISVTSPGESSVLTPKASRSENRKPSSSPMLNTPLTRTDSSSRVPMTTCTFE
jgi:hypothetical protein